MSDSYITIATKDELSNPTEISNRVIEWMQTNEFIETEKSDCILSTKDKGYKPSTRHSIAIGYDEDILKLSTCGVEVKTEREVFNAGAFTAMTKVECPNCKKNRFEGITPQDFFTDNCTKEQMDLFYAVYPEFENWVNNKPATLTCPHCTVDHNVEKYGYDDSLAFSNFGLTFWNWPDLTASFLEELQSVVGSEIIRMNGRI